jgi:Family of unknown function (DUF6444)/Transposase IS66 family/zinc-finger binding domain of transposase IS66
VTLGPPPSSLDDALRENAALRAELAAASAERALRREEIGVLHAPVAELQEALRKNSSNSSRPPSTDAKKRGRSGAKKPSGKKRGAQLGPPKHERALLPVGDVDRVVPLVPAPCDGCGGPLVGRDPSPRRRQVIELPPIRPHVTEYQLHALECAACRVRTCAPLPAEARFGFGPGVDVMVGGLTGVCRLSKRTTAEVLGDAFGVPLSVGGVIGCQKRVGDALAAPAEEAEAFAKRQRRKYSDETPWRQGELKGYRWTLVTPLVVVFTIAARRSSEVATSVLGPVLGILHTARYAGYGWWADLPPFVGQRASSPEHNAQASLVTPSAPSAGAMAAPPARQPYPSDFTLRRRERPTLRRIAPAATRSERTIAPARRGPRRRRRRRKGRRRGVLAAPVPPCWRALAPSAVGRGRQSTKGRAPVLRIQSMFARTSVLDDVGSRSQPPETCTPICRSRPSALTVR